MESPVHSLMNCRVGASLTSEFLGDPLALLRVAYRCQRFPHGARIPRKPPDTVRRQMSGDFLDKLLDSRALASSLEGDLDAGVQLALLNSERVHLVTLEAKTFAESLKPLLS